MKDDLRGLAARDNAAVEAYRDNMAHLVQERPRADEMVVLSSQEIDPEGWE